jgi:hypothetical protein
VSRYFRTDEETEAADALQAAHTFSSWIATEYRHWRWVTLALHNAAQGFMVLSLRHGNGLLALAPECTQAWLRAYEAHSDDYPEEKLDSYLGLYKKVKSPSTGSIGGNKPFRPKDRQGWSIRKLNRLRNEFIHFTPKGWALEVPGMPRICLDTLALIDFLGWQSGNIFWQDASASERAKTASRELAHRMSEYEAEYGRAP